MRSSLQEHRQAQTCGIEALLFDTEQAAMQWARAVQRFVSGAEYDNSTSRDNTRRRFITAWC